MRYKIGQQIIYKYNFFNAKELMGKIESFEKSYYRVYSYKSKCIIPVRKGEVIRPVNNSIRRL